MMAKIHDHVDMHAISGRHSTNTIVKMSFVIEEEQLSYQWEQRSALCINLQHLYHDLYAPLTTTKTYPDLPESSLPSGARIRNHQPCRKHLEE